ncbi:ROK family protein [Halorarius litoreus]|uniref:ROK family protein n=1 Tax=Halorarius litoreus TaxID=2962676 RepID=UPI0020CBD876|nr:ROK family protein [Halorarius litoreus]
MYAGVDLGATNIRAVVADNDGTIVGNDRRGTPTGPTGIAVTEAVLTALRTACEDAHADPADIRAVGIASIGPLDLAVGAVENPANLPDAIDSIPLTGPIENLVDSEQVYLHNDTNAGVIGERFHSDRNPDDMAYLTISSGIGAGVCVDGNVLSGWDGNAGEVGHMTLDPEGIMRCGCGKDGHWEAYCSGNNIPRYAEYLHDDDPVDTALPLDDSDFSAADVFEYADHDEFAAHVVGQLAHWNAMGVANLVHAYAPLVIYVGGAVALHNTDQVLDPIRAKLPDMVMANVPDVQLTTMGDDVVVRGALASAMTGGTGDRSRMRR